MKSPQVAVSKVVDASPDAIYAVLSDYELEHAKILPKPYFTSMEVEKGGRGAGTVINVTMPAFGSEHKLHMTVTEPDPGRVLVEEDLQAGVRTTFTVSPLENGTRSLVEIATVWQPKAGVAGWIEGRVVPLVTRHIYRKELDLLADYVAGRSPTSRTA